jgi:hypothetical protein
MRADAPGYAHASIQERHLNLSNVGIDLSADQSPDRGRAVMLVAGSVTVLPSA